MYRVVCMYITKFLVKLRIAKNFIACVFILERKEDIYLVYYIDAANVTCFQKSDVTLKLHNTCSCILNSNINCIQSAFVISTFKGV